MRIIPIFVIAFLLPQLLFSNPLHKLVRERDFDGINKVLIPLNKDQRKELIYETQFGKTPHALAVDIYMFQSADGPDRKRLTEIIRLLSDWEGRLVEVIPHDPERLSMPESAYRLAALATTGAMDVEMAIPAPFAGRGGGGEMEEVPLTPPPRRQREHVINMAMTEDFEAPAEQEPLLEPDHIAMEDDRSTCQQANQFFCDPLRCTREQCCNNVNFCCMNKKVRVGESPEGVPEYATKNYCCKCTPQRLAGCFTAAALAAGIGTLFWQFGAGVFAKAFSDSVAAFIVFNGPETALNLIAIFASAPPIKEDPPPELLRKHAYVIPVHGATKDIRPTLLSILATGATADQIIVMENTGGKYASKTLNESRAYRLLTSDPMFEGVHHRFATFGSKVAAEYLGAVEAEQLGFDTFTVLDDDVILPEGWQPGVHLIDDKVKMVIYPIEPSNKDPNWLTEQQGEEYRQAARMNYLKQKAKGVLAPHGAVNTQEIKFYLKVMRYQPVDGAFAAEDQKKGAVFRWHGAQIVLMGGPSVQTETPDNCATSWAQRDGSWDPGGHKSFWRNYLRDFLTDCPRTCEVDEFMQVGCRKIFQGMMLYSLMMDVFRFPIFVSFVLSKWFYVTLAALWGARGCINVVDRTYCEPHHKGEPVCQGKTIAKSLVNQLTSMPYVLMQAWRGPVGAAIAYLTWGGLPDDYFILKPFMKELRGILDIQDYQLRTAKLRLFLDKEAPVVRRASVSRILEPYFAIDPGLKEVLAESHAFIVFPNVGHRVRGSVESYGRGYVYREGVLVGVAQIDQAHIGVDMDEDQTFAEIVALQSEEEFESLVSGRLVLDANFQRLSIPSEETANTPFTGGAAVFTHFRSESDLMMPIRVGGQRFSYKPIQPRRFHE